MKLAYFSPLNPQPSGISDYSEELLPQLTAEADITLFVDGFEPSSPEIRKLFTWHDYRGDPAILETLHDYDAVVYHMGNDHRYHAGMLEVMRLHPGIVVFHDFALQDFFLGLAQARRRIEIYLEEVLACHGARATREAAEALERASTPPQLGQPTEFPLNCRIARGAEGIVVHSEWSRVRFRAVAPSVPVAHINMPIKPLGIHRTGTMAPPGDGTAPGTVRIATFGLITPGKGIEKALRALSSLKADHHFHYTLVGGFVFMIFAAIYYWYPKATGRMLSKNLGLWHFWLFFIGFHLTFDPQHIAGILGMPRRIYTYDPGRGWEIYNMISSLGAFFQVLGVSCLVVNLLRSLRNGAIAGSDPWDAWTLEWSTSSPPPEYNFETLPEVQSRRPLWDLKHPEDPDWKYE